MGLRSSCSYSGAFENRGTLFWGRFKGILFYLGHQRGTPMLGNAQIQHTSIHIHYQTQLTNQPCHKMEAIEQGIRLACNLPEPEPEHWEHRQGRVGLNLGLGFRVLTKGLGFRVQGLGYYHTSCCGQESRGGGGGGNANTGIPDMLSGPIPFNTAVLAAETNPKKL